MIDYLETLMSFRSTTGDHIAVKRLLEYVSEFLMVRGLSTSIIEYGGVYNLHAGTSARKHSRLLLQGHVDVVPGDQPFRIDGDICFGRGSYDMLFGTAAFMQLIDEISSDISSYDLAIMLSGDEEYGGFNGVNKLLNKDGYTTDICILPDAGNGFGTINIGAKGVFQPTIEITGKSHHGSRPWEGDNATGKLVAFLQTLEQCFDTSDQANSTMTITKMCAGEAMNQGPGSATVSLDIRYKDKQDLLRIENELANCMDEFNGTIIDIHRASDFQLDMNNAYVKDFLKLYTTHLGKKIEMTKAHGSSDARFFSEKDTPVIMFRPDGGGAHGDEEWLSLDSFQKFYKLLKEYVVLVATKV